MTQESIQTRYTLDPALASATELEQAISRAIEANKQDFFPLLERLVDVGDSRVKLSQKEPCGCWGWNSTRLAPAALPALATNPTFPRAAALSTNTTSTRPAWPSPSTEISLFSILSCPSSGTSTTRATPRLRSASCPSQKKEPCRLLFQ